MNLKFAKLVPTTLVPKPNNAWARAGLRYERNAVRALTKQGFNIVHNPQFVFETVRGRKGCCVPDIILLNLKGFAPIVIEVKLTYKDEAITKLRELYIPVVCAALDIPLAHPLVLARALTSFAPEPKATFEEALLCTASVPLVHWLGRGKIPTS